MVVLQMYCHFSTSEELWQRLEEDCRKPVLAVCSVCCSTAKTQAVTNFGRCACDTIQYNNDTLLTLSLPCLTHRHSKKDQSKCQTWNHECSPHPRPTSHPTPHPHAWTRERTSIKTHSIESRFVIGPSNNYTVWRLVCMHFSARRFYRLGQWKG